MKDKGTRHTYRKIRTRNKLTLAYSGRPRLSVHRSLRYLSAQIIDDATGKTLAAASSLSKELRSKSKSGKCIATATLVGEAIAQKAIKAGVKKVAFDRGALAYHGRIKALAEGARKRGVGILI